MNTLPSLFILLSLCLGCIEFSLVRTSPLSIPRGVAKIPRVSTIALPGLEGGKPSCLRFKRLGPRKGRIALIRGKRAFLIDLDRGRLHRTISLEAPILDIFTSGLDKHLYLLLAGKLAAYDPQSGRVLWTTPIKTGSYRMILLEHGHYEIVVVSPVSIHRLGDSHQLLLLGSGGNHLGINENNNLALWLDTRTGKILKQRKFEHRMALGRERELMLNTRANRLATLNLRTGRMEHRIAITPAKDAILTGKLQAASNYSRFHDFYWVNYLNARLSGRHLHLFSWHYDNALAGVNSLKARLAIYDLPSGKRMKLYRNLPPTTMAHEPGSYFDQKGAIKDLALPYFSPRREWFRYDLAGFLRFDKKGQVHRERLPKGKNFKKIMATPGANCYRYNSRMLFFDNKGSLHGLNLKTGKTIWEYRSIGRLVKWRAFGHYMVLGYDKETVVINLKGRRALLRRFPKQVLLKALPNLKDHFILLALSDRKSQPFRPRLIGLDLARNRLRFVHMPPGDILTRRMTYVGPQSDLFFIELLPGGRDRVLTRLNTRTGRVKAMLPLDYYQHGNSIYYPYNIVFTNKKSYLLNHSADKVEIHRIY